MRRHLDLPWSQPLHRPTINIYRQLQNTGTLSSGRPLILDSGCGTGQSTRRLAAQHPECLVLGVDRSQARLARGGVNGDMFQQGNFILLRAELASFWRLLLSDGYGLERHYLFYPNPWPKPGHLQRRWHGHPVFPWLLALGGDIELRCNWGIYALEFAAAVQIATGGTVEVKRVHLSEGISPFEAKYLERGHVLYSVTVPEAFTAAFKLP